MRKHNEGMLPPWETSARELMRFFIVSSIGVIVDLAIAYGVVTLLGTSLWVAASAGFVIAAAGNYALHEVWTFKSGPQRLSRHRALTYLGGSIVTLMSRLAVVALLSSWVGPEHVLEILVGGAGVSFFVNYAISKLFIFSRQGQNRS